MNRTPELFAALVALASAPACAPAGKDVPSAAGNEATSTASGESGLKEVGVAEPKTQQTQPNGERAPAATPKPEAVPVPDIDPVTGIDRNVTYEPQLAPGSGETPRPQGSPQS